MKLYQISDAIRQALDHIELDEETGEILSAVSIGPALTGRAFS